MSEMKEFSEEFKQRLEYDARQKALYDYNTMMIESRERGIAEGIARGRAEGEAIGITKGRAEIKAKMIADGVDEELIRRYFGNV